MDIDDILQKEVFKGLDDYLTGEMNRTATSDLIDQMYSTFDGDKSVARSWFYSLNRGLGGKRPYDCCIGGDSSEVKTLLIRSDWGIFC